MPKKERRCERSYYKLDQEKRIVFVKRCPHPYFGPGRDPDKGEEIDCCIFHASMDTKKDHLGLFWFRFWRLFAQAKKTTEAASTEEEKKNIWFECFGFVFPDTSDRFNKREFPFSVNMMYAQFTGGANFTEAQFSGGADFSDAQFSGRAGFVFATFSDKAYFWNATFSATAVFMDATFSGHAGFFKATFSRNADFQHVTFSGNASFSFATFSDTTYFIGATFEEGFTFRSGYVSGTVRFKETEFLKSADFRSVTIGKRELKSIKRGLGEILFDHAYFHVPDRVPIGGKTESANPD